MLSQVTGALGISGHNLAATRKRNKCGIAELCCANRSATLEWPPYSYVTKCTNDTFLPQGSYALSHNCHVGSGCSSNAPF